MVSFFLKLDWILFFSASIVLGVGLLALYSLSTGADTDYFLKQLVFSAIGIAAMLFTATLDYRHIARNSTAIYFGTLLALLLVLLFGKTVNGTAGWLSFGVFQVQPVEIAKLALIIFLASFITEKKSELGEWARLIASLVLSAAMILFVLKQPDLGSSLVLAAIWAGMILASGLRFKHLAVLFMLGAALTAGGWFTLADYQKDRIDTFLHPERDPRGSGYNVLQAMVAVGSGGLAGKGIGHGSQSQLNFLPEKHTDFIFAVVSEELGLIGAWIVISAYCVLLYRVKRIGDVASDNFGYLVAVGVSVMLAAQVAVNLGMNVGLVPVTGLPAPLLSYGGSSLLSVFLALGLLLSVYNRKKGTEDMRISLTRSSLD